MSGTRQEWAKILPLLQAFVEGKPMQRLGYDRRWVATDEMHSVLMDYKNYRIQPNDFRPGTWSIEYEQKYSGTVNGPVSSGITYWRGSSTDTPPWPQNAGITYDMQTEEFKPDSPLDQRGGEGFDD